MSAEPTHAGPPPAVSIAMIKAVSAELDADRRTDLLAAARRTRAISSEQAADLSTAIHMADLRRDKAAPSGALQERAVRELLQQARMPTIAAVKRVAEGLDGAGDVESREILLRVTQAMLEGPSAAPEEEPEAAAAEPGAGEAEPAAGEGA